jgi:hypothetical protein
VPVFEFAGTKDNFAHSVWGGQDLSPTPTSGPALGPFRFQLDENSLAMALGLGAIQPSEISNFPAPKSAGQIPAVLVQTGVVDEGTGRLSGEAFAALQVAANPMRMLAITANRSGSENWIQTEILRGASGGPCVAHTKQGIRYDFVYLPSPAEAVVLLDELLNVTDLPSPPGAKIWLSFSAFAALLAAADLLQASDLQSKLSRQAEPVPDLTVETLGFQLKQGMGSTDTRWSVSCVQPISQVELGKANLAAGLEELQKAGVVTRARNGYSFTENGLGLASSLCKIITSSSLRIAEVAQDRTVNFSDFIILRTVATIWVVTWLSVDDSNAQISLAGITPADAIFFFQSLIDPVVPASDARTMRPTQLQSAVRRCTGCGRELPSDAAFCFVCGQAVPGANTKRAPEPVSAVAPKPAPPARPPQPAPVQAVPSPPPRPAQPVAASPPGTQTPPQSKQTAPGMCPKCGAALKPGKPFCMSCGARIG